VHFNKLTYKGKQIRPSGFGTLTRRSIVLQHSEYMHYSERNSVKKIHAASVTVMTKAVQITTF